MNDRDEMAEPTDPRLSARTWELEEWELEYESERAAEAAAEAAIGGFHGYGGYEDYEPSCYDGTYSEM